MTAFEPDEYDVCTMCSMPREAGHASDCEFVAAVTIDDLRASGIDVERTRDDCGMGFSGPPYWFASDEDCLSAEAEQLLKRAGFEYSEDYSGWWKW